MSKPESVAATVNGEPIYEKDVTDFIEGFRLKNTQYETDTGWAEFLRSNGYTSESIRNYVISSVFVPKALIRQECARRGIQVSDAALDNVIEREKKYYETRYGDNSWDSVLASFGYDAASWRANELDRLLEEQLRDEVIADATPSEAEIQAKANEVAANYSGKKSYYISFASRERALSARDSLSLPTTLSGFSTLGSPVYAGWNSIPDDRDALSKEYIQALNALNAGDVSQPVASGDSWLLIYCDAVFNAGIGGESVAYRSLPVEIREQVVSDAERAKADLLFSSWLESLAESSVVEIAAMPNDLPYSVNVTIAE